jgi:GT2 family glycosyltransferase
MAMLGVVIVTWNVRELALQTLSSLYDDLQASALLARVVVVDSASSDGTADAIARAYPQAELIACKENVGFARGNNIGLRHLGFLGGDDNAPPFVYLLNPDTITQRGATQALLQALQARPHVGVVGARLSYGDGSFQHSAFAFPTLAQLWAEFFPTHWRLREGRFNGRYPRRLYAQSEPFEVDFPLGATWMLRREVIEQVGAFDEAFFLYCEEVDWAWRIKRAGWGIMSVPTAHVVHLGGQSASQVKPRSVLNLWQSRLLLYEKHYPRWKRWLAKRLIALGMRQNIRHLSAQDTALREAYQTIAELASAS